MYNIPTDSMTEFGRRLRDLRLKRGLNQAKLARLSGVSRVSINGYESGSKSGTYPELPRLIALAQALNCTLEELTGLERLRGVEEDAEKIEISDDEKELLEAYKALPENDPRRKAIDALLITGKEDKTTDEK